MENFLLNKLITIENCMNKGFNYECISLIADVKSSIALNFGIGDFYLLACYLDEKNSKELKIA